MNKLKPLGVIILAAGQGKRMKSDLPKVLHQIAGVPMITHVIRRAKQLKADKIVVIVGHKKELVVNAFKHQDIIFVEQSERLGTGHAVLQAKNVFADFDGDLLVLSGDVPLLSQMTLDKLIQRHYVSSTAATVLTTLLEDPTGYGRVVRNKSSSLDYVVEHKDCTDDQLLIREVNAGIYFFDSKLLFNLLEKVGCDNRQNEYYLPDVLPLIRSTGGAIAIEMIDDAREVSGVNTKEQLAGINSIYKELYEHN